MLRKLRLDVFRPEKRGRDYECAATIAMEGCEFRISQHGVDSLQAFKLVIRAADQKIRALASEYDTVPLVFGAHMPPVFDELEAVDRLAASLSNATDALLLARSVMTDETIAPEKRSAVISAISMVIESAGVVDVDGVHLRAKKQAHWGHGWSKTTPVTSAAHRKT